MSEDMMCCPLSNGDDGDGNIEEFDRSKPTAKKEHRCIECHEKIAIGQKYERVVGKWEGEVETFKTCLSCVEIRDHFACNGYIYGQLWQDLEESFFPEMTAGGPCMKGLSPEAKQRLFDRRMAWFEERDA